MQHKILIVDDDEASRASLREGLEEQGYLVIEASSGRQVLKTLREQRAQLLILDVLMEEQEGIETLREVRKHFPTLPVIMMSSDPFYLSLAEMLGADVTLEKPLDLWVMYRLIREFLSAL